VKNIAVAPRVKVSADGHGVVSHAGMAMVREVADRTGLSAQGTAALADTYRGPWVYAPGEVFADLTAAVADGADCIDGVGQLCGDREHVFGAKASTTTMWRLVDERIDAAHLPGVRAARAGARAAAWAAGTAPSLQQAETPTVRDGVVRREQRLGPFTGCRTGRLNTSRSREPRIASSRQMPMDRSAVNNGARRRDR